MKLDLIIWSLGINGEGSSLVSIGIIKSILKYKQNKNIKIIISNSSVLYNRLLNAGILKNNNKKIIILPKYFRNYIIQAFLKLFFPINLICRSLITLDDFPFLRHENQILYFQQAGMIYGKNIKWKLRKLLFSFLIRKELIIYTQTKHIRDQLYIKYKLLKTQFITILHLI